MSSKSSESISFPGRYWWTSIVVMQSQIQYRIISIEYPHQSTIDGSLIYQNLSPPERRGKRAKVWKPQQSFAASPPNSRAPAVEKHKKWVGLSEKTRETTSDRFQSHPLSFFSWPCYDSWLLFHICSYVFIASFFGSCTRPLGPLGRLPPPSSAPHCLVPCPLYFPNLKDVKRHSWHHKFSYRLRFQKV